MSDVLERTFAIYPLNYAIKVQPVTRLLRSTGPYVLLMANDAACTLHEDGI